MSTVAGRWTIQPAVVPHIAIRTLLLLFVTSLGASTAAGQSFHRREPTRYRSGQDDNVATALDDELASGAVALPFEATTGRLRPLLRALAVPESSQVLVFSKTSLQRHRISPHNPRALFFGRDVYVGWIPGEPTLEIAVADVGLGTVFYRLANTPDEPARLRRDDSCLSCHADRHTDDEPGLVLRSVFPDAAGDPIASAGETMVGFRTPLAERWGGWIVTGETRGDHRGNGIAVRGEEGRYRVPPRGAADLQPFAEQFAIAAYPRPTSDIGALLVLEAQATVHNLLVLATLQLRYLLANDAALAALDEHPDEALRPATARIADDLEDRIVAALLLDGEPPLTGLDLSPDPAFARDFAALWPRDAHGVQLGQLDLKRRTFLLPMSPMVHSVAFRALPEVLRRSVLLRLDRGLHKGVFPGSVRMTPTERDILRRHLGETVPDWPAGIDEPGGR